MKRYIKSATNISDLQAKIAKKQADKDKKLAWIDKKEASIQKKLELLSTVLTQDEYDRLVVYLDYLKDNDSYRVPPDISVNTWQIARDNGWDYDSKIGKALYSIDEDAQSIYNSKAAITEINNVISGYEEKLKVIKQRDAEVDEIPDCLKEFMNDIIERWNEYDLNIKYNGRPYYWELYQKAWKTLYGDSPTGSGRVEKAKLEELYPDFVERWGETRRKRFDYDYITRPFEKEYGSLNYARSIWDLEDDKIKARNERDGKNLILDLLKRVTKITGAVTDWSGLHLTQGNMGLVLNGVVIGEEGKARVESILAGGYAIQRLHIRTLVKAVK